MLSGHCLLVTWLVSAERKIVDLDITYLPEPRTSQKLEGYKESTVTGDILIYVVVLFCLLIKFYFSFL